MTVACGAVTVSLLVFPNAILWMVAVWIAAFSLAYGRARYAWLPLAACVAILLIKRPDWSMTLVVLAASMVAFALLSALLQSLSDQNRRSLGWIGIVALWTIWLAAVGEAWLTNHCETSRPVVAGRPIVCLGDSLTSGLSSTDAYPGYLQQMVNMPVLNFGRAGLSASNGLKLLPEILDSNPQVVVIELGGHDFLRKEREWATRANLVKLIESCKEAGADVVLMEIPRGFITDPYSGLERKLARVHDLELIPDSTIRQFVLRSPTFPPSGIIGLADLSDDGLHPNELGARLFAMQVRDALVRLYGPSIDSPNR
jgi:lysophospholipase L1-like esterase